MQDVRSPETISVPAPVSMASATKPVPRCFSVAPIRPKQALSPAASAPAPPIPLVKVVDSYMSRGDVPAPPPDKPWLRPGGVYTIDADRELYVKFQQVERKTRSGDTVKYGILAFQATRLYTPPSASHMPSYKDCKTFANSMKPQAEREKDALDWLHRSQAPASWKVLANSIKQQAGCESDNDMSESESTFAQDNSNSFAQACRTLL